MLLFIIFGVSLVFILLLSMFSKQKSSSIIKVISVTYCIVTFIGIVLPDGFIVSVDSDAQITKDVLHALLRWGNALNFVVLPLAIFYKKNIFKNIAIYFLLPLTIISIFTYKDFLNYYTALNGRGLCNIYWISETTKEFLYSFDFRIAFFGIQFLLALIIPLYLIFIEHHYCKISNRKEIKNTFLLLIGLLIMFVPIYVPQVLFGFTKIKFASFTLGHFILLAAIPLITLLLLNIFKSSSDEDKYLVCLVLALDVFIQYNTMFSLTINLERLPIQLCNIGSYLLLFSVLTKNRVVFNFNLIANTVGAFIAIMVPDSNNNGILNVWNMHYIYEHLTLFITPILAICLKVFPGITKQTLHDYLYGFIFYFSFVLMLGSTFNIIGSITNNNYFNVNYFFMFNKDKMIKLIPQFEFLTLIEIPILGHDFYPCLILFIFFGFNLICISFYYLIRKIIIDNEKRKEKLKIIVNN